MGRQDDLDNHANQCNPNNEEYQHSREAGEATDDNDEGTYDYDIDDHSTYDTESVD
jgi:hypothetical protein